MGFFFGIAITLILVIFASDIQSLMVESGIRDSLIAWLETWSWQRLLSNLRKIIFDAFRIVFSLSVTALKPHFVPLLTVSASQYPLHIERFVRLNQWAAFEHSAAVQSIGEPSCKCAIYVLGTNWVFTPLLLREQWRTVFCLITVKPHQKLRKGQWYWAWVHVG